MPLTIQILCDGCRIPKRETNHWYTLTPTRLGVEVTPLMLRPDGRPYAERDGLQQYYCGRSCLFDALGRWMDAAGASPPPSLRPSPPPQP